MGAPPLRAVPPSPTATGYHASPTATGYHAPTTATGYHAPPADDVRMTRSAWLGGTAGAIVVLLVIGLSLNSPGPGRPAGGEVAAPASPGSASGSALDGGDASGSGAGADASADPLSRPAPAPFAAPTISPNVPPATAARAWTPPRGRGADAAEALRQRLLTRSHSALPRTDQLLGRGYAAGAASPGAWTKPDRILRERLAADLKGLSAARARVRPAVSRLPPQGTSEDLRREAGPIQGELRRLEDARQPVRNDLKALSVRATPPAPIRAAPAPAPFIAAPAPPPPAPSEKAEAKQAARGEAKQAAKAKAPAPAGQEFIMWGK